MHSSAPWVLAGPILCALALACTTDPASLGLKDGPEAGLPDLDAGMAPDAEPAQPVPCAVSLTGPERASAGGRLALRLEATPSASVELEVPEGYRSELGSGEAVLRIPYEAVGTLTLVARARCPRDSAKAELVVRVEAPAWRPIGDWSQSYAANPHVRQLSSLFVDPEDPDSVFLYGGVSVVDQDFVQDLWVLDADEDHWEMVSNVGMPGMSGGEVLAPVPGELAFLLTDAYSGWEGTDTPFSIFRVDYGGEGTGTVSLPVHDGPRSGSFGGAFVYVPHLDRYLLACGLGERGAHCALGLYDLKTGQFQVPATQGEPPSGRYGFAYAYDEEDQRLILFSGGQDSATGEVNPATDTWTLELSQEPFQWRRLDVESPPGRRNPCFAFDPDGHRLFVWGGTPNARDVLEGLQVLELDRGFERWTRLDLPGAPTARSSGSSTFDRAGRRAIFGFGNTREEVFVDLHALEL